ncbi:MAG: penicillin-binding protein 1A [Spirochaetota bacterium]
MAKFTGNKTRLHLPTSTPPTGSGRSGSSFHMPAVVSGIASWFDTMFMRFRYAKPLIFGLIGGILIAFVVILISDFYKVKAIASFTPRVTTKIYDKNGLMVSELFRQKRDVVRFKSIPDDVIHAFIAIEDSEFYEHLGINPKGIVRAFFINIFSGSIKQGGSTITQQLSKVLLTSGERTIYRKIKEAFISIMMEMFYTKDEILGLYLNQIFLGHGTYGVESAALFYFNKHVKDLNLAESSLLAILPAAPNRFSPIKHPKRAMNRHKAVLARMVELGFVTIPQAEKAFLDFWPDYLDYINELPPSMSTWSSRVDHAPWFTEYIRRKLVNHFGAEKVYEDGLEVYTTLDLHKQRAAQQVLFDALARQSSVSRSLAFQKGDYISDRFSGIISLTSLLFDTPPYRSAGSRQNKKINNYLQKSLIDELEILNHLAGLKPVGDALYKYHQQFYNDKDLLNVEGALVSINPGNGYIEALVGGSPFTSNNQLNRVLQSKRQPGSAIKPLLYASAMESGKFTPATAILDSPLVYLDSEGGDWIPENYEGEYYGLIRLRRALALSINVISIRIADTLGIDHIRKFMGKLLGMSEQELQQRVSRDLSVALGSFEVSPLELSRAYAIIANGGKNVIPISIRYVKDRSGETVYNPEADIEKMLEKQKQDGSIQVINPSTAQVMISMLRSVIDSGTGKTASFGRPACGKTGTTNDWRDAWFIGFVPQLVTGIWMGYDGQGLSLGINQSGGSVVAPVWGKYMEKAMSETPVASFPTYVKLESARVCANTGMLPSFSCNEVIEEEFVPGTVPAEVCERCEHIKPGLDMVKKGPRDNISRDQKKTIMQSLDKRGTSDPLDGVGSDLLDDTEF